MEQNDPISMQIERDSERLERSCWLSWMSTLRRWGLDEIAAIFLEAAGPLNILLAQFVYVGQPFLQSAFPGRQVQVLARLLEDPEESRAFAAFLQTEESR